MFNYSGGMGARRTKPGLGATCYPTGVAAVPVEVLEAAMPIEFTRKELLDGSGGAGRAPRRGRAGHRVPHADPRPLVPQRGAEPPQRAGGGAGGRRNRPARAVPGQRRAVGAGQQDDDGGRRRGPAGDAGRRRLRRGGNRQGGEDGEGGALQLERSAARGGAGGRRTLRLPRRGRPAGDELAGARHGHQPAQPPLRAGGLHRSRAMCAFMSATRCSRPAPARSSASRPMWSITASPWATNPR